MVNYAINDKHFDEIVLQYYDPTLDHQASEPEVMIGIAGAAVTNLSLVEYQADGKWDDADASAGGAQGKLGFAFTSTALVDGDTFYVVLKGLIRDATWAFTVGGAVYASATAGEVTQTIPVVAGDTVRMIGYALDADAFWFDPSKTSVGEASGCAVLEGATAYVGFDSCKEPFTNYFLVDGVADDVQTQLAINYAQTLAGNVLMEAGDYDISAPLSIIATTDGFVLEGVGPGTQLISSLGAGEDVINIPVRALGRSNIELKSFRITGNGTEQHGININDVVRTGLIRDVIVADVGGDGIHAEGCFELRIGGCQFNATNRGIYVGASPNFNSAATKIQANTFTAVVGDGIFIDGNPASCFIYLNSFTSCGGDGIEVDHGSQIKIVANYIETTGAHGINLGTNGADTTSDALIAFNYIDNPTTHGINIDRTARTHVLFNQIGAVGGSKINVTVNATETFIEEPFTVADAGTETLRLRNYNGLFDVRDSLGLLVPTFTDATRGAAAIAGRVIWNSDDNMLNIDDGANWRDTDGNVT